MKLSIPILSILILAVLGTLTVAIGTLAMFASVASAESESAQVTMMLTPEQEMELAKFPLSLRTLIKTELAAGNSIVEIGHSFPSPPAGAYVKLANKVSTRKRDDGDGYTFYERNGSSYSGEFTDAKRFYFVLEPANPPPDELDMDAIRKSLEPKTILPEPGLPEPDLPEPDLPESKLPETALQTNTPRSARKSQLPERTKVDWDSSQAFSIEESAMGATRVLHFRDKRPPRELQFALERDLRTLLTPSMEGGSLCYRAKANVVGANYDFALRFEATLPEWNCYSLQASALWGELPSDHADYYRKTSKSWFESWTSDFIAANQPLAGEGTVESYRKLCEEALAAEKHLNSVTAIQQAIIVAVKEGARYYDSHKEGGTKIYWDGKRFVRSDYGDDPDERHFTDESEFLKMLYQFCHWKTTSHADKDKLSDVETWRLIQRQMSLP